MLVAEVFRAEGCWVHHGYRIELSKADKRALGNPSMPRPEIDLVAYKAGTGELLSIECKSYFDSGGIHARDLVPEGRNAGRYKMFVDADLRSMVLEKLVAQLSESGSIAGSPTLRLGMVYGHATPYNEAIIGELFERNAWALFGPCWLRDHLTAMTRRPYENRVAGVVAKLLLSGSEPRKTVS